MDWVNPEDASEEVRLDNAARSSAEIFVKRYAWLAEEPGSERRLRLQANQRKFTADTVTTVDTDEQGRTASLAARIHVHEGVVGQLHLSVPTSFQEPFVLEPASFGVVEQTVNSGEGRQVTLLLNQPVAAGDSCQLQLSGQLISEADGLLAVPDLVVNDATGGLRYVMLPTQLDRRAMEWQTDGLKRESLPEDLRHFVAATVELLPYRIVSRRFLAKEPAYRGPLRNAALRQAWVDGVLDARGSLTATAAFVVQPGRATHCSIRLPAGASLMQLVADDLPARREMLESGLWRIPLGPPLLPRVIKVSYRVESHYLEERTRLSPPEVLIGDAALPCPPVGWRIRPVGGLRVHPTAIGQKTSPAAEAAARYRGLAEVWADTTPLASQLLAAEVGPWLACLAGACSSGLAAGELLGRDWYRNTAPRVSTTLPATSRRHRRSYSREQQAPKQPTCS